MIFSPFFLSAEQTVQTIPRVQWLLVLLLTDLRQS